MDIFLDILLKPPQPFIGLFLLLSLEFRFTTQLNFQMQTLWEVGQIGHEM